MNSPRKSDRNVQIVGGAILAVFLIILSMNIKLSYAKLHIFILVPILALAFLPPQPLKYEPREIKIIGYVSPFIIAFFAVIFSNFWDNIIASRGVWTFKTSSMVGVFGHIPYEEYFWFVDHTLLSSFWTLFLWSTRRSRPAPPINAGIKVRVVGAAICFAIALLGVWLFNFERWFFMAVILVFMFPVLGIAWWLGGHLLSQQKRELIGGIALVSPYVLALDYWAVKAGVWSFSERYTSGINFYGIKLEQIVCYTVTTMLVVPWVLFALRATEVIISQERKDKSVWVALLKSVGRRVRLSA